MNWSCDWGWFSSYRLHHPQSCAHENNAWQICLFFFTCLVVSVNFEAIIFKALKSGLFFYFFIYSLVLSAPLSKMCSLNTAMLCNILLRAGYNTWLLLNQRTDFIFPRYLCFLKAIELANLPFLDSNHCNVFVRAKVMLLCYRFFFFVCVSIGGVTYSSYHLYSMI